MKKNAQASMADAFNSLNDPAAMAEAAKMMKDPNFVAQVQKMAKDPQFQSYMAAVSEIVTPLTMFNLKLQNILFIILLYFFYRWGT